MLRLPHTGWFLAIELQIFCWGQNGVEICQAISLPHTSQFFVATNHAEAWGQVIQNQDGAYSINATLITFPNWLRCAWALWEIVLVHYTLANKAYQDILISSTVGYRPTSPDLVADLSEFTAHWPTSEDFLLTKWSVMFVSFFKVVVVGVIMIDSTQKRNYYYYTL